MPNDLYTALNLRRIDGTGESVLSYIKEHTPQIKNWETAGELSKSNKDYNTTGKNIGLLYTKDADKMYMMCLWRSSSMRRRTATSKSSSTARAATPAWLFLIRCPPASSTACKKGACL